MFQVNRISQQCVCVCVVSPLRVLRLFVCNAKPVFNSHPFVGCCWLLPCMRLYCTTLDKSLYSPCTRVHGTFVRARDKCIWEQLWNSAVLWGGHLQAPGIVLSIASFVVRCSEGLFCSGGKQEVALKYQFQHKDLQFAVLSWLCTGERNHSPPCSFLASLSHCNYLFGHPATFW